jgi:hypothetical protein
MMLAHCSFYSLSKSTQSLLFLLKRCGIRFPWQQNPGHVRLKVRDTTSVLAKRHQALQLELVNGILQLRLLLRRQVINGDVHDVANFRHLDSLDGVPPGVPKSVLTQNPHPAPSTQQAEQSWLNTRADSKACQSIFLKINKKTKQLNTKAWNLSGGTRQFHICGWRAM